MPYKTFPLGDEHVIRIAYHYPRPQVDPEVVRRLYNNPDEAKNEVFEAQVVQPVIVNVKTFGPPKDMFTFFELQTIMEQAKYIDSYVYTAEEVSEAHFDEAFPPY